MGRGVVVGEELWGKDGGEMQSGCKTKKETNHKANKENIILIVKNVTFFLQTEESGKSYCPIRNICRTYLWSFGLKRNVYTTCVALSFAAHRLLHRFQLFHFRHKIVLEGPLAYILWSPWQQKLHLQHCPLTAFLYWFWSSHKVWGLRHLSSCLPESCIYHVLKTIATWETL